MFYQVNKYTQQLKMNTMQKRTVTTRTMLIEGIVDALSFLPDALHADGQLMSPILRRGN